MRRASWRWPVLAALLAFALIGRAAPAAAQDASPHNLSYVGAAETGGRIIVTLTADRSGVLAFNMQDVPLPRGACGVSPWTLRAYFDPPAAIENNHFDLQMGGLLTVHNPLGFTATGEVGPDGGLTGTVRVGGTLTCSDGDPVGWTAGGTVDTPPAANDVVFENDDASVRLALSPDLHGITALELDRVSFLPCIAESAPANARAFFDPAVALFSRGENALFDTDFWLFRSGDPARLISIDVQAADAERVTLRLSVGGFLAFCNAERTFALAPMQEAGPTPTASAGLPNTGAQARSNAWPLEAVALLAMAGTGSLAAAWWRRKT